MTVHYKTPLMLPLWRVKRKLTNTLRTFENCSIRRNSRRSIDWQLLPARLKHGSLGAGGNSTACIAKSPRYQMGTMQAMRSGQRVSNDSSVGHRKNRNLLLLV